MEKYEITACPNDKCPYHNNANIPLEYIWYKHHGKYVTKSGKTITRYQCKKCKKTFTFRRGSLARYLQHDDVSMFDIRNQWLNGMSVASLAKKYGISESAVRIRIVRARNAY